MNVRIQLQPLNYKCEYTCVILRKNTCTFIARRECVTKHGKITKQNPPKRHISDCHHVVVPRKTEIQEENLLLMI